MGRGAPASANPSKDKKRPSGRTPTAQFREETVLGAVCRRILGSCGLRGTSRGTFRGTWPNVQAKAGDGFLSP